MASSCTQNAAQAPPGASRACLHQLGPTPPCPCRPGLRVPGLCDCWECWAPSCFDLCSCWSFCMMCSYSDHYTAAIFYHLDLTSNVTSMMPIIDSDFILFLFFSGIHSLVSEIIVFTFSVSLWPWTLERSSHGSKYPSLCVHGGGPTVPGTRVDTQKALMNEYLFLRSL